jgi:hypothetical protein
MMKKTVIRIFDGESQVGKIEILCMDMSLGSPIVMKINEAIDLYNVINESNFTYDIKSEMYDPDKKEDMQGQG